MNRWAINNRGELDGSQDSSSYKNRAITYLQTSNKFITEDFIKMVILDEDPKRRDKLSESLKQYLDEQGLSGQSFVPNQGSLTNAKRKHIRQTAEGIRIEWQGDMTESNLKISSEKDQEGYYNIVIKTSDLKVLDNSR